jgi:thiol:disulfide interchange protein DsbG
MKRRPLVAALGAALVLAACGKESAAPSAGGEKGKAASTPVTIEAIEAGAKGFNVGATMAARTVYVFFDPQCPHCAALWEAARPLKSQARFVWIPVALINDKSAPQGAAIMNAADPVAMMDQHEASLRNKQGGVAAMGVADAQKDIVKRNTDLMNRFGFGGVPTVVAKHAQSGQVVTLEGSMPTAMLAQKLGLSAPS